MGETSMALRPLPDLTKSFEAPLRGPKPVIPWYNLNPRRDASPCVIRRKFEYTKTNLEKLAYAERLLDAVSSLPPDQRHPDAIENLQMRVTNAQEWFRFSEQTLRNAVRYAMARIKPDSDDGEFLRAMHPGRKPKGRINRRQHKLIRYYSDTLDEFILAKRVAANYSGSGEALQALMQQAASVIQLCKKRSPREDDDAKQQGVLGLLRAARGFYPHRENEAIKDGKLDKLARFNTYSKMWVHREMEARRSGACKPGMAVEQGKHITVASIDAQPAKEATKDGSDYWHPVAEEPDHALSVDVRDALANLQPLEQEMINRVILRGEKISELAREKDTPHHKLRATLKRAKEKLSVALSPSLSS